MGHIVLRLDRVMADRKMSLNELSEKVGVANVNLSKMKNGRISAIRFSTLAAICEVFTGIPLDKRRRSAITSVPIVLVQLRKKWRKAGTFSAAGTSIFIWTK